MRRIAIGVLGAVFLLECLWAALVVGVPVMNQHFSGDATQAVTVTGQCERDRYIVAVVVRHMYRCPARWTVNSSYGRESWESEGEVLSARELTPGDVVDATAEHPPIVPITGFALWVGYGSLVGTLAMIVVGVAAGIRSGSDGSGGGGLGSEGGSCGGGGGD